MRLSNTKEQSKYITFLLYGNHGIGKTPLIGTCPKPFIVDIDKGQLTNQDLNIPSSLIDSTEELEETFEYLDTKKSKKQFDTIILEGGWELSDFILEGLKKDMKEEAEAKAKAADLRQAYFQMAEVYKFWIRKFRSLPYHFGLTTLMEEFEVNEVKKYRPHFQGNVLKTELPGMFNQIFCLHYEDETEEDSKIVLQCKPCSEYDSRDRSKNLKKYEKLDLSYIFKKIKGDSKNGKRKG